MFLRMKPKIYKGSKIFPSEARSVEREITEEKLKKYFELTKKVKSFEEEIMEEFGL